jgi:AraC-like DNA-binding protein
MDNLYFCQTLSHLMGLPVRLYRNGILQLKCNMIDFVPDPVELVLQAALAEEASVRFFESNLMFFGLVRHEKARSLIIIGPSFSIRPGSDQVHTLMRLLGISHERIKEFRYYLDNIPTYPVENFIQVLCFIHYFLNKKKLSISELIAQDLPLAADKVLPEEPDADPTIEKEAIHNTYQMEQMMLSYIAAGQTDSLKMMFAGPPTGSVGRMAHDELRQRKNMLICAATLASRAAIQGGLSHEISFALSDYYIQKAELIGDYSSLANLSMAMLIDFASHVAALDINAEYSNYVAEAIRYINKNVNQQLTLEQISEAVGISRTHLCLIFKRETGETPVAYLTKKKMLEAKRLLSSTKLSLGAISEYLGYSSQSHFQKVFHDQIGETPLAFRNHGMLPR